MSIVDRAKNIILKPREEWVVIASEPATVGSLFTGYAIILAAVPVVAGIIAQGLLGIGGEMMAQSGMSMALSDVIIRGILGYAVGLAMLYVMALIVNAVSPSFNGKSDIVQSLKLMTYASTPSWVAGIYTAFLAGSPFILLLVSIAIVAYTVYIIYLGVHPVLAVPQEKVAGFTVVVVLVYIVVVVIVTAVLMTLLFSSLSGGGAVSGA